MCVVERRILVDLLLWGEDVLRHRQSESERLCVRSTLRKRNVQRVKLRVDGTPKQTWTDGPRRERERQDEGGGGESNIKERLPLSHESSSQMREAVLTDFSGQSRTRE